MPSPVFAISCRTHYREGLERKIARLFKCLAPEESVTPGSFWALKLHFGELGGQAFIRPHLVRVFVEVLKDLKARPFLTDTNTLYAGGRGNSVDHLETALKHGFGPEVTGAPVIIADGLRGGSGVPVETGRGGGEQAWIASEVAAADGLIVLSHFKGHELTGFGGALKNLGMGTAARRGKLRQHSDLKPKVVKKKCIGCGRCLDHCLPQALFINDEKAGIDPDKCVGCAACLPVCPEGAVAIPWEKDSLKFMRKMSEYALAALQGKGRRAFFINFLTDISPLCDCVNHSDTPIVPNLGILASCDPVALDLASAELVNNAPGLPGSALPEKALKPGADKWEALHPGCNWPYQLQYAEEIGLGSRDYQLVWLPEARGV